MASCYRGRPTGARRIVLELTDAEAESVLCALALATAGGPEDIGLEDNRSGRASLQRIEYAREALVRVVYP